MGSWGGSGFAALFGGLMAQNLGWRSIFFAGAAISVIGLLMVRGTPESRAEARAGYKFDLGGVVNFMIAMVALQIFATQGASFGWVSWPSLTLLALAVLLDRKSVVKGKRVSVRVDHGGRRIIKTKKIHTR